MTIASVYLLLLTEEYIPPEPPILELWVDSENRQFIDSNADEFTFTKPS